MENLDIVDFFRAPLYRESTAQSRPISYKVCRSIDIADTVFKFILQSSEVQHYRLKPLKIQKVEYFKKQKSLVDSINQDYLEFTLFTKNEVK